MQALTSRSSAAAAAVAAALRCVLPQAKRPLPSLLGAVGTPLAVAAPATLLHASAPALGGGTPGEWNHVHQWKTRAKLAAMKEAADKAAKAADAKKEGGEAAAKVMPGKEGTIAALPGETVLVLDENLTIQAERENFTAAFEQIHAGVIRYEPGVTGVTIDPTTLQVRYLDGVGAPQAVQARVVNPIAPHRAAGSGAAGWLARAGLANSADGRWAVVNVLSYESTAVAGVHVIGDAASCGLPKAGHVGNQEAKICADAIVRLLGGGQPDPAPVANSACYSPITVGTASWLTAVYQYDAAQGRMVVAANGGNTAGASAVEAASISARNFRQMHTWFDTLMRDSFA